MKQFDMFKNEIEIAEMPTAQISRKTKTMQEMYGEIKGKTCKTCKHCECWGYNRNYYKCILWMHFFNGRSAASDIRLKNIACGKYKEME